MGINQEENLIDILSRLPVKSLLRFNCVYESWKKLISEPYFKKKYLNHAKNQLNEMYGEIPLPQIMCLLPISKIGRDVDASVSVLKGMLCVYYNNKKSFNLWGQIIFRVKYSTWFFAHATPPTFLPSSIYLLDFH
ncbi:hypothetical protein RND71_032547 [Anisodus tanguticus]|uniref:F-box domain-containing protein n=1 Tax=Anisodus tanguticus TaxID=243964 RepID=A0AAE1UVC9_9SOLA|nr:hypothetical protein RND71_032547 [Anisodus tanguticus]